MCCQARPDVASQAVLLPAPWLSPLLACLDLTDQIRASPYFDPIRGYVLVGSGDRCLHAVRGSTGELAWKFEGAALSLDGTAALLGTDVVAVGSNDGYLYALSAETGQLLWKAKTGYWLTSQPLFVPGGASAAGTSGDAVVVSSGDGNVYSYSLKDGAVQWTFALDYMKASPTAKPSRTKNGGVESYSTPALVVHEEVSLVVVGGDDRNLYALHALNGSVAWVEYVDGQVESAVGYSLYQPPRPTLPPRPYRRHCEHGHFPPAMCLGKDSGNPAVPCPACNGTAHPEGCLCPPTNQPSPPTPADERCCRNSSCCGSLSCCAPPPEPTVYVSSGEPGAWPAAAVGMAQWMLCMAAFNFTAVHLNGYMYLNL